MTDSKDCVKWYSVNCGVNDSFSKTIYSSNDLVKCEKIYEILSKTLLNEIISSIELIELQPNDVYYELESCFPLSAIMDSYLKFDRTSINEEEYQFLAQELQ